VSLKHSQDAVSDYLDEHAYLPTVAGFSQQHTSISIYSNTTVVRAPEVLVRGRWTPSVQGFIGEELLLNHRRSGRDLGMQLGVSRFYGHDAVLSAAHSNLRERTDRAIELPQANRIKSGLTATITARRSARKFSGRPATLAEVATLLWHGQGISGALPAGTPQDPAAQIPLRNAPSGGGLYPIRLGIVVQHIKGLEAGQYEYQPHSHTLYPVNTERSQVNLERYLWAADIDLTKVAFALVYMYDLYVNSQKYGDSGVVFALIETGAISQNIHLAATSLGMIACDQGGYDKQNVEKAMGYDGTSRHVVHFTLVGHGEV
jgi:SagB-type dehydrogenase family enzyme